MLNEVCQESTADVKSEEKIDAMTFIRTVKKEEVGTQQQSAVKDNTSLKGPDQRGFGEQDSLTDNIKQECKSSNLRKRSEDNSTGSASSLVSRILKPSLRMKAFANNRQDTFHSLDMHVDHSQQTAGPSRSSPLSLSGELVKNITNDFLKMPSIESMEISPANNNKHYKKICSEPTMAKTKSSSLDMNGSGSGIDVKGGEQKKRILHTFTQPDGCVIGYTTEESLSNTPELERKDLGHKEKDEKHK